LPVKNKLSNLFAGGEIYAALINGFFLAKKKYLPTFFFLRSKTALLSA
jgi:hypothetical protein